MAYVNNLIPKGTIAPVAADGDFVFFSKERFIVTVEVLDTDEETVVENHPLETVAILNLASGQFIKADSDVYMVSLSGGSVVPSPDPTKLDKTLYNTDQGTLVTKINTVFAAIKAAADFDAAKTAITSITRTDV